MISRRQLLILLGLAPTAGAASPADFVQVQAGTLPIILTAPHGGRMAMPGVDRRTPPSRLPAGATFVTGFDPETDRLALGIAAGIRALTKRDVYFVVARFNRRYIDANRPPRIAFDQPAARPYYELYHQSIRRFVDEVRARHRHALLIDVHGQHKFPDALVRGTLNGRSVQRLVARGGVAAVTGPKGLFGQLEQNGFRVFPANVVPPVGRNEDAGFNGGYTLDRYGSHRADGIDAVQLEFGAQYREKATLDNAISASARAVVAFSDAYLH
jgi:N-formylglutamate amidohydrolase